MWNREQRGMVHEDYWVLWRALRNHRFQGMQAHLEEVMEVTDQSVDNLCAFLPDSNHIYYTLTTLGHRRMSDG